MPRARSPSPVRKTTQRKKLGYNARLSISLGVRNGPTRLSKRSLPTRRAISRGMEKYWTGRRLYNVGTINVNRPKINRFTKSPIVAKKSARKSVRRSTRRSPSPRRYLAKASPRYTRQAEYTREDGKYPPCFHICGASRQIYDYVEKNGFLGNADVQKLLELHTQVLCAEIAVTKNKANCAREIQKWRALVGLSAGARYDQVVVAVKKAMANLVAKIVPALPAKDVPTLARLQKTFEEIHFPAIKEICQL